MKRTQHHMNQLALPLPCYNQVWPTHGGKHLSGYVKKAQQLVQGFTYSPNAHADDEKLFNYLLNHAGYSRSAHHIVQVDAVIAFLGSHATPRSVADSLFRLTATKIDIAGYEPDPETGEMKPWVGSFSRLEFKYSGIRGGTIIYAFSSLLRETINLTDPPAPFALLDLSEVRQFKTVAGGRLYEWLSLKAHRKWDRGYQVTKEQFVRLLGDTRYTAIGPDGHIVIPRWDNYVKHVVNPAVQELREIAGFDVSVVFRRGNSQGRRIESILLTVMKKGKLTQALLDLELPHALPVSERALLRTVRVTRTAGERLVADRRVARRERAESEIGRGRSEDRERRRARRRGEMLRCGIVGDERGAAREPARHERWHLPCALLHRQPRR